MLVINIDGPDYSGKTTLIEKLKEFLISNGTLNDYHFSRQPNNAVIRSLLLNEDLDWLTRLYLFSADRSMVLNSYPKDKIVISDRSIATTYAYQGVDKAKTLSIKEISKPLMKDNITVHVVLLPPREELIRRVYYGNRGDLNVLDKYCLDNLDEIINRFENLSDYLPNVYLIKDIDPFEEFIGIVNNYSLLKNK